MGNEHTWESRGDVEMIDDKAEHEKWLSKRTKRGASKDRTPAKQ